MLVTSSVLSISDDELTPYDMSGDQEFSQTSPPRYLRDCLESMAPQNILNWSNHQKQTKWWLLFWNTLSVNAPSFDILWGRDTCGAQFEGCWEFGEEERLCSQRGMTATQLVQCPKVSDLQITLHVVVLPCFCNFQISVQLTKVLLHMEDKYSINCFLSYRQATMVALAVTDSIPVWSSTSGSALFSFSYQYMCLSFITLLNNVSLCSLKGDAVFDHRVLLFELQSSPAARYLGGENKTKTTVSSLLIITDIFII